MAGYYLEQFHRRSSSDLDITDNVRANRFLLLEFLRTGIAVDFGPNLDYFERNVYEFTYHGEKFILFIWDNAQITVLVWPQHVTSQVIPFRELGFTFERNEDNRVVAKASKRFMLQGNRLCSDIMTKFYSKMLGPAAENVAPNTNISQLKL